MTQYHVIHNWLWLGAVESLDRAAELTRLPAGFDRMVTRSSVSLCSRRLSAASLAESHQ